MPGLLFPAYDFKSAPYTWTKHTHTRTRTPLAVILKKNLIICAIRQFTLNTNIEILAYMSYYFSVCLPLVFFAVVLGTCFLMLLLFCFLLFFVHIVTFFSIIVDLHYFI